VRDWGKQPRHPREGGNDGWGGATAAASRPRAYGRMRLSLSRTVRSNDRSCASRPIAT
jgi:hypothetical protein